MDELLWRRAAVELVSQESAGDEEEVVAAAEVNAIVVAQVETKMKGKTGKEIREGFYLVTSVIFTLGANVVSYFSKSD